MIFRRLKRNMLRLILSRNFLGGFIRYFLGRVFPTDLQFYKLSCMNNDRQCKIDRLTWILS